MCVDLLIHPITAVLNVDTTDDDVPEANIQEEDVLAYVQFADDIDPLTGAIKEQESFLT